MLFVYTLCIQCSSNPSEQSEIKKITFFVTKKKRFWVKICFWDLLSDRHFFSKIKTNLRFKKNYFNHKQT